MAAETLTAADFITKRQRQEFVYAQLRADRSSFEAQWRDLADHLCPTRPQFMGLSSSVLGSSSSVGASSGRNNGTRKNQKIIDETGVFALDTLAAGLHAGMTNPAHPWFKLGVADPELSKFAPVKEWLYDVEQRIYQVLGLSNFYHKL
ncbi:MAG TPA: portal protein, partial [Vicinamibacterales bacterium]